MTRRILTAALLAGATAACAMGRKPPAEPGRSTEKKPMMQEWKGAQGGEQLHAHMVISDAGAWDGVWRELGKPAPPLDFSRFSAVVVYVGRKPTGGWTAVFDPPQARGDDLLVRYRIPKPAGFVTQAFTSPWKIVAVPKPKGRVIVEFERD